MVKARTQHDRRMRLINLCFGISSVLSRYQFTVTITCTRIKLEVAIGPTTSVEKKVPDLFVEPGAADRAAPALECPHSNLGGRFRLELAVLALGASM
jgi:hypothetical protein